MHGVRDRKNHWGTPVFKMDRGEISKDRFIVILEMEVFQCKDSCMEA